jgi:hypothetical protein
MKKSHSRVITELVWEWLEENHADKLKLAQTPDSNYAPGSRTDMNKRKEFLREFVEVQIERPLKIQWVNSQPDNNWHGKEDYRPPLKLNQANLALVYRMVFIHLDAVDWRFLVEPRSSFEVE